MQKVLITGIAGFLGFSYAKKLSETGLYKIYGIDNLNEFGDYSLKINRLNNLGFKNKEYSKDKEYKSEGTFNNITFQKIDITDFQKINTLIKNNNFDYIIDFASQAGVKYSFENPQLYIDSNIKGFTNILESIKNTKIKNLLFSSTSAVYGDNEKEEQTETDTLNPISPYAVTAQTMENMAKVYSNKYNIPITALRIFTVFGEYGRTDMSILKFANQIKNEEPINLYNFGENKRDFLYVEDFTEIVFRLMNTTPKPFEIFNIGSGNSYKMKDIVKIIEKILNKKATLNLLEKDIGDVESTKANIQKMISTSKFNNFSNLEKSIEKTINWFENK